MDLLIPFLVLAAFPSAVVLMVCWIEKRFGGPHWYVHVCLNVGPAFWSVYEISLPSHNYHGPNELWLIGVLAPAAAVTYAVIVPLVARPATPVFRFVRFSVASIYAGIFAYLVWG